MANDNITASTGRSGLHPDDDAAREAVSEMIQRWETVDFLEAEVFLINQGVINDTDPDLKN